MPSPVTIPAISNTWTPTNAPVDAYLELGSASQSVGLGSAKMLASNVAGRLPTIAALKAVVVAGRAATWALVDNQGAFVYDSSSSATADDITIVAPTVGTGRWIRRYDDFPSVKWFGAVGNGTADDTTALQNAIQWALTNNIGVLFFPAGTYKITAAIVLVPPTNQFNLTIMGSHLRATVINNANAAGANAITLDGSALSGGQGSGMTIANLSIIGNAASGHGVYLKHMHDVLFDHVLIGGHGGKGLYFDADTYTNHVRHSYIDDNTGDGVYVGSAGNAIDFIGTQVNNNGGYGFHLVGPARAINIIGCDMTANANSGLIAVGVSAVNLKGCYIEGNASGLGGASAQVFLSGATTVGGSISGCYFNGAAVSNAGVRLEYANNWEISGNFFENHTTCSIQGTALANGITIGTNASADATYLSQCSAPNYMVVGRYGGAATSMKQKGAGMHGAFVKLTYGTSITPDLALGQRFLIQVTNNTGFTINAPINAELGDDFEIVIYNASGAPMGTVTWNAAYRVDVSMAEGAFSPEASSFVAARFTTVYDMLSTGETLFLQVAASNGGRFFSGSFRVLQVLGNDGALACAEFQNLSNVSPTKWRFGAAGSSGYGGSAADDLIIAATAALRFLSCKKTGVLNFNVSTLPSSPSGLASGDVWCDTGAANVLKIV